MIKYTVYVVKCFVRCLAKKPEQTRKVVRTTLTIKGQEFHSAEYNFVV